MTPRRRIGRRGNGEGSIHQLPDGRWRGSVFLGYRDGKPHRKYVTRRTRADVAAEIRVLIEAQRQGQVIATGGMTVAEWLTTYLEQVAQPAVRPRTLDRYASDIGLHIVPAIGRYRLDKLRPAHWPVQGLPPVRLHDLRHTAASLLLAQNVPARVVMEILGHSQIALTMNTYSHVAPEVSREAAERMARALWQGEDQADEDGQARERDGR